MGCNSMEKTKQKPKFKKGLWSPEEDEKLRNYILRHGHGCWSSVPINAGLQRNGKSCRLRWINYLRPGLKRGMFSSHEEEIILTLHRSLGNKWSQIAQHLPGRTDNEIKNFWHSNLKKKVAKVEKIESVLKAQLTDMSPIKKIESPISSSTYTVSSSHSLKEEGLSSIDSNQLVGHQSCLPKLFFTEWFALDNVNNSNNLEKNNIQGDQSSLYNSQDVTPIYNMDLEEVGFAQGIQYKEGTSSNNEFYNGEGSNTFDPQLNFEDKTQQNGWDDLFYGNYADILDDLLMIDNLTYAEELNYN